jgi:hypothetical protein
MAALVYLETSVISYLTAWPSRDVIVAGRQQLTHEWWSRRRVFFDVVVSELVHLECADGDPVAAARRADFLAALRSLDTTPEAEALALALLKGAALPAKARADALHIAIAATPPDLEFGAYRQRRKASARRGRMSPRRLRAAHSVYTRRAHGRGVLVCRYPVKNRRPLG